VGHDSFLWDMARSCVGHDTLVCCSVSQCVAVLQCVAVCCSALQCVAVCCSVVQCVSVCHSVLQCVAVCCSVHCNISFSMGSTNMGSAASLQHTATRCNTRRTPAWRLIDKQLQQRFVNDYND